MNYLQIALNIFSSESKIPPASRITNQMNYVKTLCLTRGIVSFCSQTLHVIAIHLQHLGNLTSIFSNGDKN